jgi:signal transduction histidine kinase
VIWLRKNIFAKYFFACSFIILLSITFLGTILVIFSVKYSNDQKNSLYSVNATAISQIASQLLDTSITEKQFEVATTELIGTFSVSSNANIFITGKDGRILESTSNNPEYSVNKVPSSIMDKLSKGKSYTEVGNLGGKFSTQNNTVGVPITQAEGKIVGAVFVSANNNSILFFVNDIIRIFLFCAAIVLLLSFVVIYFVTASIVRPVRQMSVAVKSFAGGDFSARVPVHGRDEIAQLAVSFNNMAMSLATLEEMRRSFVANVSHELRTPMTSISGFVDGILDGTIPPEKSNYYLTIVSEETKRLSRLVRSLLDIAKIESGVIKANAVNFDIVNKLNMILIGFEKRIEEKNLDIRVKETDDQLMVNADPDLTHQILYNLIDNAVKFADNNGYIEINFASVNQKVFVGIKNSGMGIPSQDLPFVFDRFYKTDKSRSKDKKGLGLGLYIVKSILNLQGEDIVVKSEEGKYCEFVLTLKKV